MNCAAEIILRLKEVPSFGPLVIPLPKIFKGICLNCGRKTNNILNYLVQKDGLGLIVGQCIRKNVKNAAIHKYAITVCSEACLQREIELVLYCVLEEITK